MNANEKVDVLAVLGVAKVYAEQNREFQMAVNLTAARNAIGELITAANELEKADAALRATTGAGSTSFDPNYRPASDARRAARVRYAAALKAVNP